MMRSVRVLGIEVDDDLLERWRAWLMPPVQPFAVPAALAERLGLADDRERLSFELLDTFELYGLGDDDALVWLDRAQARTLPAEVRRAQPAAHRWPRRRREEEIDQAVRFVQLGRRPSRHADVTPEQWSAAERLLPGARALAGTFPRVSGPNCFAAVMGAAGVLGAAGTWMQPAPFEEWLAAGTRPGGADDEVGTVLVWRDPQGAPAHAAVTLGGGWLLHKPSQGWMSPTKVLGVRDGFSSARSPGRRVSRRTLRPDAS